MNELTLNDLDRFDVIKISSEQNIKIINWINKNKDMIKNIDNIFNKVAFKIINDENYYYFIYFEFNKKDLLFKVFKGYESSKDIIHHYEGTTNFTKEDYVHFLQEQYDLCDLYVNVIYQKNFYNENISRFNTAEEMNKHIEDCVINFIMCYFNILAYSQLNKEYITKQIKTHSHKTQSKKNKRAGKKPKVKLTKQTIITLNTDNIQPPTEEEKREYERHTFGWTVRGHWREYKSGKKVWVKPQVRGDKDNVQGKVYEV